MNLKQALRLADILACISVERKLWPLVHFDQFLGLGHGFILLLPHIVKISNVVSIIVISSDFALFLAFRLPSFLLPRPVLFI